MKNFLAIFVISILLAFSSFGQTRSTTSPDGNMQQFYWVEASLDSAETDTSGYFYFNDQLTGNSLYTTPFNCWYDMTVAATGAAADSVSMLLIFDGYHNTAWAALDTITIDISGTSGEGVQLMNFNNWRSPENKYRIRATNKAGGSAASSFKVSGVIIKPVD